MKSTINRSATVVKLPNPSFHGPCENVSIEYIQIYIEDDARTHKFSFIAIFFKN